MTTSDIIYLPRKDVFAITGSISILSECGRTLCVEIYVLLSFAMSFM